MAASMASLASASISSQKQRKALLKKERRKRKRQALARARGQGEEDEESDAVDEEEAEKESQRLHAVWLERESLAQREFMLRHEREEAARQRKELEERRIKEEWDAQQKKEEEDKEQKLQEKRERETKRNTLAININSQDMDEAVQKMLDQAESQLENGGPWMNPEAPVTGENSVNYGTERDIANCPFFLKTGACRFGDRCSRKHVHPASSPTLMIRAMFVTFGMEQCRRDDYDTDACLEHSEEDLQEYFLEFYHDVLPEFKSVGKVLQFKVSCNFEPHLKGNVYVQFETEEQCRDAFVKFNGRWYAQKQLHCEICPVTRWKNAICGLFDRQKCPKGKHCNFLHVFRNPGNEFWEADRDLHMSPDRGGEGSYRAGRYSERCGERSWRQRNGSRSPPRSERSSYSRRGSERRRSRSRSRERSRDSRASHHQRVDNRSSWSRSVRSRKEHYRSRSRERGRSRSRSGDRERDQNRTGNKHRERDQHRSRSRDRQSETVPGEMERARDRSRSRSRSTHRERQKQSRESSPKKSDRKDKTPEDTNTPRRHKHSKKSKKKSKKKHKKKSCSPGGPASSDESEEKEEQGERDHPAASPGEEVNEAELVQNAGGDAVVNSSGDTNTETMSVLEVKSLSHSVVPNEVAQNGDVDNSDL